ncbi:class II fructose-bisphosphate aldolase, partial [Staphylococcus epidermidis]|uniref:class II fructose-bisphosphate aldolase n=1 Tax=Staphylococcus epidermidis TaxID=1282 RepID=UPI0034D985BD
MLQPLIHHLNITIPLPIHLHHPSTFQKSKQPIHPPFTSLIIHPSHTPFQQNLQITSKLLHYPHHTP